MRTTLLFLFGIFIIGLGHGQQKLSVSPEVFDETQEIVVTARDIPWSTTDVYLWAFYFNADGNFGGNSPQTGSDFNNSPETARMTRNADGSFSYTLTPTTFFNATGISELGFLAKSKNDANQTRPDLRVEVGTFKLILNGPTKTETYMPAGSSFNISATSSKTADFELFANGTSVDTQISKTNYSLDYVVNENTDFRLVATESGTGKTAESSFSAKISPVATQAPVPAGMQDGFNYDPKKPDTATFVLFAPQKQFVNLIGNFNGNDWAVDSTYLMNKDTEKNRFWITVNLANTSPTDLKYQYVVENTIRVADPYSTLILDEFQDTEIEASVYPNIPAYPTGKTTTAVSYVNLAEAKYIWKTTNYTRPSKSDLVIYELLLRDFDDLHDYKEVLKRLDYLEDLGINAIELLPVQEFDGNKSWGYNPSFHMALDKYYGTREDLKTLVDECHSRGMAVILDVVYNHATGQNPYYRMYNTSNGGFQGAPASDSPFFNVKATHSYSVFNDFNHSKQATQDYIKRTSQYWINEFKIDGFRWDLTKGFTQNCTDPDQDCTNGFQADRVAVLKTYADYQWAVDPDFYIIFEHLGSNQEEKQWAEYRLSEGKGIMLWNIQNAQYNQNTMGYGSDSNFDRISYKNQGFTNPNASVGYMESHDEERLMFKNLEFGNASGSYDVKNRATSLDRMETAGAFFFTVPGPKMIWQFGELGYDLSIFTCNGETSPPQPYGSDQCKLDEKPDGWAFLDDPDRVALKETWKKLIALKKKLTIFETTTFTIEASNENLLRKIQLTDPTASGNAIKYVTIIGNFGLTTQSINPQFQETGSWFDLLTNERVMINNSTSPIALKPGQFFIYANEQANLGLTENNIKNTARLYPNPAKGTLYVNEILDSLSIHDLTGKVVKTATQDELINQTYELSRLTTGFYLVKISRNGTDFTSKIIIE